jgi:putative flippase GtrA
MRPDARPHRRPQWKRLTKFAFVGVIGIAVQIVTLHWVAGLGCGYLSSTVIAVEAAILHNFVWHENFTWRDREKSASAKVGSRLLRFHLSNGLISIAGNVLLMRMLVGGLGMGIVPANLASITVCCLTNFLASDRWVFVPAQSGKEIARSG